MVGHLMHDEEGYSHRCPICECLPGRDHADWCDMNHAVNTEPPAKFKLTSSTGGEVTVTGTTDLCAALVTMVTSDHKVTVEQLPGKWRVYWGSIETRHADFYDETPARRLAEQLLVLLYGNVTVEKLK